MSKNAADIGIVMNQSKEEHQVGFVGPGSVTSMRMLHKEGKWPDNMEKSCPTQRVLGTLLTYSCAAQTWMDSDGTLLGCGVFSQTHCFSAAWSGRHS